MSIVVHRRPFDLNEVWGIPLTKAEQKRKREIFLQIDDFPRVKGMLQSGVSSLQWDVTKSEWVKGESIFLVVKKPFDETRFILPETVTVQVNIFKE
jgi:hypothetical protein